MATLTELRAKLTAIEASIDSIMETGQEYSVVGSHSVKKASLSDLEAQRQRIRGRILRKKGYNSRTTPDFND